MQRDTEAGADMEPDCQLCVCNLDTVDKRHTLRNAESHYVAQNTRPIVDQFQHVLVLSGFT